MNLPLTKISETASKITLGWTPVPGAIGYRFQSAASLKWSHTWDPTRDSVTFSKAAWYKVEALMVGATGDYPSVSTPSEMLLGLNPNGGFPGWMDGATKADSLDPEALRIDDWGNLPAIKGWAQPRGVDVLVVATGLGQQPTLDLVAAHPDIRIWELDNEPYFVSGLDIPAWARQMRDTAKVIKQRDSSLKLLVPLYVQDNADRGHKPINGVWTPWEIILLDAAPDLPQYIDGWAVHPYSFAKAMPWTLTEDARGRLQSRNADKPFHLTEIGWSVGPATGTSGEVQVSEVQQAQYVAKVIDDARARPWVSSVYIYSLQSWGTGFQPSFGLYWPDGRERQAAAEFRSRV